MKPWHVILSVAGTTVGIAVAAGGTILIKRRRRQRDRAFLTNSFPLEDALWPPPPSPIIPRGQINAAADLPDV